MPSDKNQENRRVNKPIMEKRRRARINTSLNELKALVLEGMKKDPERHSKLEKADILEMAVKHVKSLQDQSGQNEIAFRSGYAECAREIASYLEELEGRDSELKRRLMVHIASSYRPAPVSSSPAPTSPIHLLPTRADLAFLLPGQPAAASRPVLVPSASAALPLTVCTEAGRGDTADLHCPSSPTTSVTSYGSSCSQADSSPRTPSFGSAECQPRPDSPQPLDLVSHNRPRVDDSHWRPW